MENLEDSMLKRFLKALRLQESTISMILGALVVVVVGVLVYNYFSSVNRQVEPEQIAGEGVRLVEEEGQLVPEGLPTSHTVTKGEHLWKIAEKYYSSGYNWVDIARENKLVNANYLTEGQELMIPKSSVVGLELVEKAKAGEADSILTQEYMVVKGDSLWMIAVRAYSDGYRWPEIWQANQELIADSDIIEEGMLLKLPR